MAACGGILYMTVVGPSSGHCLNKGLDSVRFHCTLLDLCAEFSFMYGNKHVLPTSKPVVYLAGVYGDLQTGQCVFCGQRVRTKSSKYPLCWYSDAVFLYVMAVFFYGP